MKEVNEHLESTPPRWDADKGRWIEPEDDFDETPATVADNDNNETGYVCAFIWNWQSWPRRCYQCGEPEASHLNKPEPTTADINQKTEAYWKQKEGFCLSCGTEISIQDQYCGECESFLTEMYDRGDN